MSARILDGKLLAATLKQELKKEIVDLKHRSGQHPRLVNIVIGEDAASWSYALSQQKAAEALGIHYELQKLSAAIKQADALELVRQLNGHAHVHGIMINKPLPAHIDFKTLIEAIAVWKDVEGLNPANLGRLLLGKGKILPCTAAAAVAHARWTGETLKGKEAVVVGRSEIVGKPAALLLLEENITTTICHSATSQAGKLEGHLKNADIIIAAIGKPLFIKGDWIKPGAIVIDVGINEHGGKIVGDVDFASAAAKAACITPVPGGVGPVTSVMLMKNVVEAFKQQLFLK
ncbi:MAG: bifunctional 5,10-methylenetetrahydrofolate dehydrogenase/5,10-methenyltetrahydrofolate cyclohydrolase [Candidatus Omnitrophica bacterium]|nr:bifunctional 5,10-methylenetetrahydrofolate dehydrogenase/5,10-methenyltetrahydrofolate cyclohydrolase [Candidatus Omnitrophota bacterium]